MDNSSRQLRLALLIIIILVPIATIGFMITEHRSLGDSLYFAVITLATIGYGDVVPITPQGRAFVAILIPFGLSSFAFALQAIYYYVFANPVIVARRQARIANRAIARLDRHYIICGEGEMVERMVTYVRESIPKRTFTVPFSKVLAELWGYFVDQNYANNVIDVLVVITQNKEFSEQLRELGVQVILGNPADDDVLLRSGIKRAQALVALNENDSETLLTILTARNLNRTILITAAVLDDALSQKMLQVGANHVLAPYAAAGSFLNNATFRPAVNDFFTSLTYDKAKTRKVMQLRVGEDSTWIGKTLRELQLAKDFEASIIGMRLADGTFTYVPENDHVTEIDDLFIVVGTHAHELTLKKLSEGSGTHPILWQTLPAREQVITSEKIYTLHEAEKAITALSKHFIICGTGKVAHRALSALNPERAFVIVSDDKQWISEWLKRGFRVIEGKPTDENTLVRAGIKRAQAIMVTLEDEATSIVTILTARSMNKHLLITATAYNDEIVTKLERAGADRVVSPFHVAASFMLLATMAPDISDYIRYIMFNYQEGLETTELYMESDSPWIGRKISELALKEKYDAGVIGIRLSDLKTFIYAPSKDYVIQANEVLIVVTPMRHSDYLREIAHATESKRPTTLRTRVIQSSRWTQEEIQKMLNGRT